MSKKGFFAARKPEQGIAASSTLMLEDRFDLEDFERQIVEEARANNETDSPLTFINMNPEKE